MNRFLLCVVLTALLLPALPSQAEYSATATIDWSSFTVEVFSRPGGSSTPVFEWSTQYGDAYSEAFTASPPELASDGQSEPDFLTEFFTSTATAEAQSSTLRSSATLLAAASSQNGSNPAVLLGNYSYGRVENYGSFTLTGEGLALISLDWSISLAGAAGDFDNAASAGVYLYSYYRDELNQNGYAEHNFDVSSVDAGTGDHAGTLSLVIYNSGTGTITGDIYTGLSASSSAASVPEPGAFGLLLAGLGCIGWAARRRFN